MKTLKFFLISALALSIFLPSLSTAQDSPQIQLESASVSSSGSINVIISNNNPQTLKINAKGDLGLVSNIFSFDSGGHGNATLTGLSRGQTYTYKLYDVNGVLSPSSAFTFTTAPGSASWTSYPTGQQPPPTNSNNAPPTNNTNFTNIPPPVNNLPPNNNSSPTGSSAPNSTIIPNSDSTTPDYSAGGLVTCTNTPDPTTGIIPDAKKCDFNAFMALINKIMKFVLFDLAVPIAAIMFAYAGFELVTSGGSTEQRGKAKRIFTNVALGLIIAVAAWLIVNTILAILGYSGDWIGFVKPTL